MPITPLHRALGHSSSPLAFSLLLNAIEQQVQEREDLDWKKELPNRQNPAASVEFAKDIAAMVNNGGGMIVYGMAEAGSRADHIESVTEWDESAEQRLRSWAYTLIQPPVYGLEFSLVEGAEGEGATQSRALILNIPTSPVRRTSLYRGVLSEPPGGMALTLST